MHVSKNQLWIVYRSIEILIEKENEDSNILEDLLKRLDSIGNFENFKPKKETLAEYANLSVEEFEAEMNA